MKARIFSAGLYTLAAAAILFLSFLFASLIKHPLGGKMGVLEFLAAIIPSLAWPIAACVIVSIFRKSIITLLGNLEEFAGFGIKGKMNRSVINLENMVRSEVNGQSNLLTDGATVPVTTTEAIPLAVKDEPPVVEISKADSKAVGTEENNVGGDSFVAPMLVSDAATRMLNIMNMRKDVTPAASVLNDCEKLASFALQYLGIERKQLKFDFFSQAVMGFLYESKRISSSEYSILTTLSDIRATALEKPSAIDFAAATRISMLVDTVINSLKRRASLAAVRKKDGSFKPQTGSVNDVKKSRSNATNRKSPPNE